MATGLLFLLPVIFTVAFSFTNMSTATGIRGGVYLLTPGQLKNPEAIGISKQTAERLTSAGYEVTQSGIEALAQNFGTQTADDMAKTHLSDSFASRRDMERALKDLPRAPLRKVKDRKTAAEFFAVSILGTRFPKERDFRVALAGAGVGDPSEVAALVDVSYTGWRWTTENFKLLWQLPSTWRYALNTLIYVGFTLAFNVLFGLFLAVTFFYLPQRAANFFAVIWFLPRILPKVMYALMWTWFTWDTGFLAIVTGWFGMAPINWMKHTEVHAWVTVILVNGFVGASICMIIFGAALRAIPRSLFHAAMVDGASRWMQVRHIILPQLRWPILFLTCYETLSLLTSFDYIILTTDGGPGGATEVWSLAAYHAALNNYGGNLQYGLGSAFALFLVFVGLIASLLYFLLFNFNALVTKPRIEQ